MAQTMFLINPWSGARIERDMTELLAPHHYAKYLSDEQMYMMECEYISTDAEWFETLIRLFGEEFAGTIILGS